MCLTGTHNRHKKHKQHPGEEKREEKKTVSQRRKKNFDSALVAGDDCVLEVFEGPSCQRFCHPVCRLVLAVAVYDLELPVPAVAVVA